MLKVDGGLVVRPEKIFECNTAASIALLVYCTTAARTSFCFCSCMCALDDAVIVVDVITWTADAQ